MGQLILAAAATIALALAIYVWVEVFEDFIALDEEES